MYHTVLEICAHKHTPHPMSPPSNTSSLSIHLHISDTSVMSNKAHTVKDRRRTYALAKDQHSNFLHAPPPIPPTQGCNEAYKAW